MFYKICFALLLFTGIPKFNTVTCRYLRILVEPHGKIAAGNTGAGDASWLFVDEMIVK